MRVVGVGRRGAYALLCPRGALGLALPALGSLVLLLQQLALERGLRPSRLVSTLLVVLKSTHRPDDIRRHATVLSRLPAENKNQGASLGTAQNACFA